MMGSAGLNWIVCACSIILFHIVSSQYAVKLPVIGDDVIVNCGNQEINIQVSSKYLDSSSRWLESARKLCFSDRGCHGRRVKDGSAIVNITNNFLKCGNKASLVQTVNGSTGAIEQSFYQFSNTLIYDGGSSSIDRDIRLMQFNCRYPMTQLTNRNPELDYQRVLKIMDYGGEMGVLDKVVTRNFESQEVTSEQQRIQIKIDEPQLPDDVDRSRLKLVAVANKCWVESDGSKFQFLQNGCPVVDEDVFSLEEPADDLTVNFLLKTSHFVSSSSTPFTVHCVVGPCNNAEETCKKSCGTTRKRRSAPVEADPVVKKYSLEFEPKEFILYMYSESLVVNANVTAVANEFETSDEPPTIPDTKVEKERKRTDATLLVALLVSITAAVVIICVMSVTMARQMRKPNRQTCC